MPDVAPDYRERERALDPAQSFICEAPAGSGKTELLTQRFLNLLARVDQPEEILAITFTRKATGEMRERILSALHAAKQTLPAETHKQNTWKLAQAVLQRDNEKQWQLLENPARLRIQTFDSLCASLTRQLPLESSLGAQPQVREDADDLYRQAVRRLLASFEQERPWNAALAQVLALLDNHFERFENLMVAMLQRRQEWLPLMVHDAGHDEIRQVLENNLRSVIVDHLDALRENIPAIYQRELVQLAAFAAANLRRSESDSPVLACLNMNLGEQALPASDPESVPQWLGIATLLTIKGGAWRKSVNKTIGFPAGDNAEEKKAFSARKQQLLQLIEQLTLREGLNEDLHALQSLPLSQLDTEQWHLLRALFQIMPVLVAQLTLVFKELNAIDFAELSLAAARALGDADAPTSLALRMDYRLQHILVDEFQDTSLSQVELLNSLTAGWAEGDGRTLFCVGDAMQSIYSFRGANVGLFLRCREQGLTNVRLQSLRLQANFRSQAAVVEWNNRVFNGAFPQKNDISRGAVQYTPSVAVQKESAAHAVQLCAFVDNKNSSAEAQHVVELVRKSRAELPQSRIAILVRTRDHASAIMRAFKASAIRYRAVDMEPLQNRAVIQDLLALTRALLHPADRTAWLALLRAPFCGLTLSDLEMIANFPSATAPQWPTILQQCHLAYTAASLPKAHVALSVPIQNTLFAESDSADEKNTGPVLSDDAIQRLKRVLPVLQVALAERERKPFRQWIEGCWLALGAAAALEDETALKNAAVFFDLLENWEYASQLPAFSTLLKKVERLYAQADAEADDSLQIMSIHKSKGLEFDVVIVPALQRTPRVDDVAVLMWRQRLNSKGEAELLMAPLSGKVAARHPTYEHLRCEQSRKTQLESCRLLYVACTRARQRLYLLAQLKSDPKDNTQLKAPARSSLLWPIWESTQNILERIEPPASSDVSPKAEQDASPALNVRALHRLPRNWQFPALPEGKLLNAYIPQFNYDNSNTALELNWQSTSARIVGTLVHRFLQHFSEQGIENWSDSRIEKSGGTIQSLLRSGGVSNLDLVAATEKVQRVLKAVVADEKAKFVLSSAHDFAKSEYPLTMKTRQGSIHLVIDRLIKNTDASLWIIDYKTSEPAQGQSLEDFIAEQVALYREKMDLYQQAVRGLGYEKSKSILYFPLVGHWCELKGAD